MLRKCSYLLLPLLCRFLPLLVGGILPFTDHSGVACVVVLIAAFSTIKLSFLQLPKLLATHWANLLLFGPHQRAFPLRKGTWFFGRPNRQSLTFSHTSRVGQIRERAWRWRRTGPGYWG